MFATTYRRQSTAGTTSSSPHEVANIGNYRTRATKMAVAARGAN